MDWDTLRTWDATVQDAMAAGDFSSALEALVRGYQHLIVGFCTHMLGDASQGEDVAQDVFLAAYRAMPSFHRQASVRTWLFAIARKRCLQVLRNRRRRERIVRFKRRFVAAGAHREPTPSPDETPVTPWQQVQVALQQLPEADRALLLMRYDTGLPLMDVAYILGISVSSVRRRLAQALHRLREVISDGA